MKNKNLTSLVIIASTLISVDLIADEMNHANMDHAKHMMQMGEEAKQVVIPTAATAKFPTNSSSSTKAPTPNAPPLKEAGNAIFGTIQETIKMLDADPKTDWTKVDLESLRQHLIDMENFTSGVDVLSNEKIEKGSKIVIRAKSKEAHFSLERALKAHPSMMQSETGWTMDVKQNKEEFTLTIETQKPEEVARLRALGYIGVMALGDHHQVHHWMMASGSNPHNGQMNH